MANRWRDNGNSDRLYFGGLQNHVDGDCSHEIKRHLLLGRKAMTNLDSILKGRHYFASQGYGFSSGHVWMWELDSKESWAPKNWCFWTVVLEKTFESPCTARRSNQSILKEISPEYSLEGLMLKLKLQYIGHLMQWTDSLEKALMLGKTRQEEIGTTEDEMVGWHHQLNGHGFGWTLGVGDGQGGLACCDSWGTKESDMTEQLNWTELKL